MSTALISIEEVSKHNSPSDCWIVLDGQVWDITEFAPSHPGGPGIIYRHAGQDATRAYSEFHAPSLIKNELPASNLKGKIDPSTITNEWLKPPPSSKTASEEENKEKPPLSTIINLDDFEHAARKTSTPKTWAFYSSAADDLITRHANRSIFSRIWLRPRVMRDVRTISTRTTILGTASSLPIFISPAAMAKLIHPEGELCIARAAASTGIIQCISTSSSYPATEILTSAPQNPRGKPHPFFFQLYLDRNRSKSASLLDTLLIHHPTQLKAIFVTADAAAAGKREADERLSVDPTIIAPNTGVSATNDSRGGGYGRIMGSFIDPSLCWDDIPFLRRITRGLPLVLKGVTSAADVKLAWEHGLEGVLLSNHGGRNLDTAPAAIITLLECHRLCPHVFGGDQPNPYNERGRGFEILVDGGIRRGTDVLKCLALGARAVGLGRPVLFANAYGQEGVEKVVEILREELEGAMRNCGVRHLKEIGPELVNTGEVDGLVPAGWGHGYVRDWRRAKL